jgi:hypothetical protein
MAERFARIPVRAAGMRNLRGADLRVLIAIAAHADADGRAYPSMATLAALTAIRREDIPRAIRRLERSGLLRCESRGGTAAVNLYAVLFEGEVSADLRTGVSTEADSGVRTCANRVSAELRTEVSAPVRTGCPHNNTSGVRTGADQTNKNIPINRHTTRKRVERQPVSTSANGEFDTFWRAYPSRGAQANPKKPAREKFEAAVKRGVDPELLVRAAGNYAEAMRRSGTAGRFIKTAEVWLNKASWEQYGTPDEPERLHAGMI